MYENVKLNLTNDNCITCEFQLNNTMFHTCTLLSLSSLHPTCLSYVIQCHLINKISLFSSLLCACISYHQQKKKWKNWEVEEEEGEKKLFSHFTLDEDKDWICRAKKREKEKNVYIPRYTAIKRALSEMINWILCLLCCNKKVIIQHHSCEQCVCALCLKEYNFMFVNWISSIQWSMRRKWNFPSVAHGYRNGTQCAMMIFSSHNVQAKKSPPACTRLIFIYIYSLSHKKDTLEQSWMRWDERAKNQ